MAWNEEGVAWDRLQSIALAEVDRHDEAFRITTRRDVDDLAASVARLGLQLPPLVRRGAGGWAVVSGFRRVEACRRLGWENLPARVAAEHRAPYACACLAVGENTLARALNPIEVSRSLALLERLHPERNVPPADLSALGLPINPALATKLAGLCRLPEPLQEGVLEESIPFSMALELGGLETPTALALARVFRKLRPSLNKQREILTLVREIAGREACPIPDVLEDPELGRILDVDEGDANRKTGQLRAWLRRRRFPGMARAEENFKALRGRLGLGGGPLRLTPPKDFEGTGFTLTLDFQTVADIRGLRGALDDLLRHPELPNLVGGKGYGFSASAAPRGPEEGGGR
jgi:hypothetical protein